MQKKNAGYYASRLGPKSVQLGWIPLENLRFLSLRRLARSLSKNVVVDEVFLLCPSILLSLQLVSSLFGERLRGFDERRDIEAYGDLFLLDRCEGFKLKNHSSLFSSD